jgi:hypothetical protein
MAVVKKRVPLKKKKLKRVGAEEEVVIKIGKPPEEEPKEKVSEELEQESGEEIDLDMEDEEYEEKREEEPEDLDEDIVVISLGKPPLKEVETIEEEGEEEIEEEGEEELEKEPEVVVEGEPVEVEVEEEGEKPAEDEIKKRKKLAALVLVIIVVISSIGIYVLLQNQNPVAKLNLSHETAFAGDLILMDGSNSTDDNKIVEYIWHFKPGVVYSETSDSAPDGKFDGKTSHTYEEEGDYTVRLIVRDEDNMEGTASSQIEITELIVTIPLEKIGDDYTYDLNGSVDVENQEGLWTGSSGTQSITLKKVHIDYEGEMISKIEETTAKEDGFGETHQTLKRYNYEDVTLSGHVSGTATTQTPTGPVEVPLNNLPIQDGELDVQEWSYVDLTTKKVIQSYIDSHFEISAGSEFIVTSDDEIRSYSNLREESAVLNIEDLSEDRTFKVGDGHTDKIGDISYTWEVESVTNIKGYPSLGIQVDIDRTTKDRNNIREFDMWLWITNDIPLPIRTNIYTKIVQDGTTTIIEYNNEIQENGFTRGVQDIPYESCSVITPDGHYHLRNPGFEFVDWDAEDDIPDMGGNTSSLDSFLPQDAIDFAKTNSGGLQGYLGAHSEAYIINGYYNETQGNPLWNLTFGEEGDESGYYAVVEDTGGGSYTINDDSEVSVSEIRNSTSDFDKILSFSASEQVFERDSDIYDSAFDPQGVTFHEGISYGARANIIYPSISITISLTIERAEYGYYLEKVYEGGSFSSAVDAMNGQLIYVWKHQGDDVLSLITG